MLTIVKIVLSLAIVIVLAEISKRTNPKLAGIIAGLPLGTGLSIYFVTLEQGTEFAVAGVPWGIASLAGALIFCLVYLVVSRISIVGSHTAKIFLCSVAGITVFIGMGYVLSQFALTLLSASLIFILLFTGNLWITTRIIGPQSNIKAKPSTVIQYILRGLVVGGILLLITTLAPLVGSKWANILSSFPSTLFPLLLILHYEEKDRLFPYVILGFSLSVTTLYVFYLLFVWLVPVLGLNIGYLLIYLLCGLYLFLLHKMKSRGKQ